MVSELLNDPTKTSQSGTKPVVTTEEICMYGYYLILGFGSNSIDAISGR